MQYIDGIENYHDVGKSVVTFGKFDGLHKGHQKLVNKVKALSSIYHLNSIVCSFDMNRKDLLVTQEERKKLLEGQVDYLVRGVFTDEFRRMSAEDFIRVIIKERFNADYVVVGADFHFGYGKMGDRKMLEYYSDKYDYRPIIIYKECYGEHSISSTYIKESIRKGDISLANAMLGYTYSIDGIIKPSKRPSHMLGLPTFELQWLEEKIIPAIGVYFTRATIDGISYYGISDIGTRPTVTDEEELVVNTNLFGYSGNAYGKKVELEFLEFHRKELKFMSISDLQQCVAHDIRCAKKFFGITD